MTKGKNVVISDPRPEVDVKSTPSSKVVMEELPNGEEIIIITIKAPYRQPREEGRRIKFSS
jgi:hypothetical protein